MTNTSTGATGGPDLVRRALLLACTILVILMGTAILTIVTAFQVRDFVAGESAGAERLRAASAVDLLAQEGGSVDAPRLEQIARVGGLADLRIGMLTDVGPGDRSIPLMLPHLPAGSHLIWSPRPVGEGLFATFAPRRLPFVAGGFLVVLALLVWLLVTVRRLEHRRRDADRRSRRDALTGLLNRAGLDLLLERPRGDGQLVMIFDLDDFKGVNDRLGHAAGDEVLRHIAMRLLERLGGDDRLARIGGDEFAMIGPQRDKASIAALAQACIAAAMAPIRIGPHQTHVGLSIGIAPGLPGERPRDLLVAADAALYRAKSIKGGAFCFAGEPIVPLTQPSRISA